MPAPSPLELKLSPKLKLLHQTRPDLQAMFDLGSLDGRAGFLAWWLAYGSDQYKEIGKPTDEASLGLAQASSREFPSLGPLPVTHMLVGAWRATNQFWTPAMRLDEPVGQLTTTTYWHLYWPILAPGRGFADQGVDTLLRSRPAGASATDFPLIHAEYLAWRQWHNSLSPDWQDIPVGGEHVRVWYYCSALSGRGHHRCLLPHDMSAQEIKAELTKLAPRALKDHDWLVEAVGLSADQAAEHIEQDFLGLIDRHAAKIVALDQLQSVRSTASGPLRNGANIIGYITGELGIGEDARMLAASLEAVAEPFSLYSYPRQSTARHEDRRYEHLIEDENAYDHNIFCLPAVQTMQAWLELPAAFFEGRRNIAYMPWELRHWPEEFAPVLDFADEIWTISDFLIDGIRRVTDKPVHCLPPAVTARASGLHGRAHFGLPEGKFLFLFVFDLNSSFYRKNPEACLAAFLAAFPDDPGVGLVLKCMYRPHDAEQFSGFLARCAADPRIRVLNETLSRQETVDLIAACDAFVSLHRAEGFGRCIAEAMLLGKPVVTTGYSGNLDFCNPDTAFLVRYEEVSVKPEAYWYSSGQVWAEPDVQHAAVGMRRILDEADYRRSIATRGMEFIAARHSPQAAGLRYLARIRPAAPDGTRAHPQP